MIFPSEAIRAKYEPNEVFIFPEFKLLRQNTIYWTGLAFIPWVFVQIWWGKGESDMAYLGDKMVIIGDLSFFREHEILSGVLKVRDLRDNKKANILFTVRDDVIELGTGLEATKTETNEIQRHLGLLYKKFQQHLFGYPSSITFIV
jgi:hypothetical protein